MMSYIELPANTSAHPGRKALVFFGFIVFGLLAYFYFTSATQAQTSDTTPPYLYANPPLNAVNPLSITTNNTISVTVTYTDNVGIQWLRHCFTNSASCDPGTSSSSTFSNGQPITQSTNGTWYLCTRAADTAANWSATVCNGPYVKQNPGNPSVPTLLVSPPDNTWQIFPPVFCAQVTDPELQPVRAIFNIGGLDFNTSGTLLSSGSVSCYTWLESAGALNTTWYAKANDGTNSSGASATRTVKYDPIAPRVNSLSSNSPTNGNPQISFAASDTGGSGLTATYEIYRAQDNNGAPGSWSQISANATSPFTDNISIPGIYWYGIHALDVAGNCIDESGKHCGGVYKDSLDIRAAQGPVRVVVDNTPPQVPALVPPPGTYNCSSSTPLNISAYAEDEGFPKTSVNINLNLSSITRDSVISVTATDAAGNQSSNEGEYFCDSKVPPISFVPAQVLWFAGDPSVTITTPDDGSIIAMNTCWANWPDSFSCVPAEDFEINFICNGRDCNTSPIWPGDEGTKFLCVEIMNSGGKSVTNCSGPYQKDSDTPTSPIVSGNNPTNKINAKIYVNSSDSLSGVDRVTVDYYKPHGVYCSSSVVYGEAATFILPTGCYGGIGGTGINPIKHPLAWLKQFLLSVAQAAGLNDIYRFSVVSFDKSNNQSQRVDYSVTIDLAAPAAPTVNQFGTVGSDGQYYINSANQNSVALGGACSGLVAPLYINNVWQANVACFGTWATTINMSGQSQGPVTVTVFVSNTAGNYSSASRTVTKDTTAPVAPNNVRCTNSPSAGNLIVTWGSTDAGDMAARNFEHQRYTCATSACSSPVASGSATAIVGNNLNYNPASDGYYTWQVRETDVAGNTGSFSSYGTSCLKDSNAPSQPAITSANLTKNPTPNIVWSASTDSGSGVKNYLINVNEPGGAPCVTNVTTTATNYTLPSACHGGVTTDDGAYVIKVQSTDNVGNISAQATQNLTIDTTAPSIENGNITISVATPGNERGYRYGTGYCSVNPKYVPCNPDSCNAGTCTQPDPIIQRYTNSASPTLSISCTDSGCVKATANPQFSLFRTVTGATTVINCNNPPANIVCAHTDTNLQITFSKSGAYDHNGYLNIDLSQVFKDAAENTAKSKAASNPPLSFNINNDKPKICTPANPCQ